MQRAIVGAVLLHARLVPVMVTRGLHMGQRVHDGLGPHAQEGCLMRHLRRGQMGHVRKGLCDGQRMAFCEKQGIRTQSRERPRDREDERAGERGGEREHDVYETMRIGPFGRRCGRPHSMGRNGWWKNGAINPTQ